MNGYSSYQGYKVLLKYGLGIRPSLIFVSFNINDRRFMLTPDLADSDRVFSHIARADRFQRLSEASYFVWAAGLAGKWLSGRNLGIAEMIGDTENSAVRLDKVVPRVSLKDYRENLSKMARWAKENNSAIAFIVLGDNPNQSHSAREGRKRLAEKDYQGAIKILEEAKDEDEDIWFAAPARLYLSKAYAETGRLREAEEVLSMQKAISSLVGGYPLTLDTDYHEVMRSVAAEHGIPVIEAATELNKMPEIFWDYCHFDEKGHEIVGQLVADTIKAHFQKVDLTR
jgi:lysophospholipase L1-like esterase